MAGPHLNAVLNLHKWASRRRLTATTAFGDLRDWGLEPAERAVSGELRAGAVLLDRAIVYLAAPFTGGALAGLDEPLEILHGSLHSARQDGERFAGALM